MLHGINDRFRGCLLGLAVGEALGAPIETAHDRLHAALAEDPPTRVRGGAHVAMYTARALVQAISDDADEEGIGRLVAASLVRWALDPTTAERPVEPTTRHAVAGLLEGRPRHDVAHPHADPGLTLVMALPVGLAYADERVRMAARAACAVTHRHPRAISAATWIAALVSRVARGAALDATEVDAVTEALYPHGLHPDVHAAALAAADLARALHERPVRRLEAPEPGRRPRSFTVLERGVVGAIVALGQPSPLQSAVSLAARTTVSPVDGCSAVAGALVGAALGTAAIPPRWSAALDERDALLAIADALFTEAIARPAGDTPGGRSRRPGLSPA